MQIVNANVCSSVRTKVLSGSQSSSFSLRSVPGQSQVSLRSVSGQSHVSLRSVSGLKALLTQFIVQSEPKILRLVSSESPKESTDHPWHH